MISKKNQNYSSSASPKNKAPFMLRPIGTQLSKFPPFSITSYSPNATLSPRSLNVPSVFNFT